LILHLSFAVPHSKPETKEQKRKEREEKNRPGGETKKLVMPGDKKATLSGSPESIAAKKKK
jgi:hypothetical protein